MADAILRAPFPWFGGKSRVASMVWERLGDVRNYVEPFAGSLAVLLGRPTEAKVETVNDIDAHIANFWRAVKADADAVAQFADAPVNEADLHARHRWLVETRDERLGRLTSDPDFFDAKVAGWWVWGQSLWIGSGWCKPVGVRHSNGTRKETDWKVRPDLSSANGRGGLLQASDEENPQRMRADRAGGRAGVLCDRVQESALSQKRPHISTGHGQGIGVHKASLSQQLPQLSGDQSGSGRGILRSTIGVYDYMAALAARLRRVRVCCGDWSRVISPAVTTSIGTTAVFLDPPYHAPGTERSAVYNHDDDRIWHEVRDWAVANGDNSRLRIALCGYEGDHAIPATWDCVSWKAHGGYGRSERGQKNRARERIWFSPHCLTHGQGSFSLGASNG